jgi:hypothetical protein
LLARTPRLNVVAPSEAALLDLFEQISGYSKSAVGTGNPHSNEFSLS